MSRIAVFVDAGYFFAQGSTAIWGAKQPRASLDIIESAIVAEFTSLAVIKAPHASLLRIYWYDGASGRGPSLEQLRLARLDNLKLRLGFINSQGQQKGVDSLIVTDLVELARNGAMTDALLLAGDEDVRIGVVIAQNYGVRVHLLGIVPSRGSQSHQLMQEADTTFEWDAATMAKMIAKRTASPVVVVPPTPGGTAAGRLTAAAPANSTGVTQAALGGGTPLAPSGSVTTTLDTVTDAVVAALGPQDIAGIKAYWGAQQRGVPPEFDGRLIASGRSAISRDLDTAEKRHMRTRFTAAIRAKP